MNVKGEANSSAIENDMFMIRSINKVENINKLWTIDLKANIVNLKCFLDTGAEANVMSYTTFKN